MSAPHGWKRPFEDPIPLPRGRHLVTFLDAGNYITKLPKAEQDAPEWKAAMEAEILVATSGGPTISRGSASCGRSIGTSSAYPNQTGKRRIGAAKAVKASIVKVGAMSAFAHITDSSRTSRHVRKVP